MKDLGDRKAGRAQSGTDTPLSQATCWTHWPVRDARLMGTDDGAPCESIQVKFKFRPSDPPARGARG